MTPAPTAPAGPAVLTNVDPSLRSAWHPVLRVADLGTEPVAVTLLGEHWVVVRLDGVVAAFADRCPHRLVPLSAGSVDVEGGAEVLRCAYHGWCFDGSGACTADQCLVCTTSAGPAKSSRRSCNARTTAAASRRSTDRPR